MIGVGVIGPELALDTEWPLLLCGCHCPVKGRVCCLVVGMEAPRSISELKYEVGAIGILPLREEPLSIPLPELFTNK